MCKELGIPEYLENLDYDDLIVAALNSHMKYLKENHEELYEDIHEQDEEWENPHVQPFFVPALEPSEAKKIRERSIVFVDLEAKEEALKAMSDVVSYALEVEEDHFIEDNYERIEDSFAQHWPNEETAKYEASDVWDMDSEITHEVFLESSTEKLYKEHILYSLNILGSILKSNGYKWDGTGKVLPPTTNSIYDYGKENKPWIQLLGKRVQLVQEKITQILKYVKSAWLSK